MTEDAKVAEVHLTIQIGGETHTLGWAHDQSLLDTLFEAGISAPSSCRAGKCGSCVCTLVEGEVRMDHNEILEEEDLQEGYILGCQSRPITDTVKIVFE